MQKAKDVILTPRLEAYFLQRLHYDKETGCTFWRGSLNCEGYGVVVCEHQRYFAHRVSYCFHYGVTNLPDGFELDHLCRIPPCVDWAHLEAVTTSTNNLRGTSPQQKRDVYAARTHCKRGHALTPDNVFIQLKNPERGWIARHCRACFRVENAASREYRIKYLKASKLREKNKRSA